MQLIDVDIDGQPEIVAAAQANAFRTNAVFVLELDSLKGHGPLTPDYELTGGVRARESHYLHFPQTVIGYGRVPGMPRPIATRMRYQAFNQQIMVTVQDLVAERISGTDLRDITADLYYYIDLPEFVITRYGTVDSYDFVAAKMLQGNLIERVPDRAYFEWFLHEKIQYLVNERWVTLQDLKQKRP